MRPAVRPLAALAIAYVGIAVCYSIGYGQAMSQMAYASDDANRLLAKRDYSNISGMDGPLSPFIQLGVLDAIRFQPKSLLFGVFTGLWTNSDQVQLAQQNAGIIHPGPPNTGLSEDDLKQMAEDALNRVQPVDPGKVIRPGSVSKDELLRRAKAYAAQTGQTLPNPATLSREEIRKRLKEYGITVTK
jgi:hypothetical protein